MSFSSTASSSPLRQPLKSNYDFDNQIYCTTVSEDPDVEIKLQEKWLVQRRRIFYILAVATLAAVILSLVSVFAIGLPYRESSVLELESKLPEKNSYPEVKSAALLNYVSHSGILDPTAPENSDTKNDQMMSDDSFRSESLAAFSSLKREVRDKNMNDEFIYCVISADKSLSKFPKNCNSVKIVEMDVNDPTEFFDDSNLNPDMITNIEITVPLSETFVRKLIQTFPNIRSAKVSINQLCIGSEEMDDENRPKVNLPNIERLEIEDAMLCHLTNWILTKWQMPKVQKIIIRNSNIPKTVFENTKKFISSHRGTIQSVEFVGCYLCQEFSTSDLQSNLISQRDTLSTKLVY